MAKVGFRIDTIQPARPDQSVQQGSALTTVVAAEEDKILFPKTDGTKGSFGSVVIRLCQAIFTVVAQRIPLVQYISERFAQTGLFRQRLIFFYQPFMQRCQQWFALRLSGCQTLFCREAAYFFFYRVQLTDTFQGFFRCRCVSAYTDIMDFSAGMGPTCGFCQRPSFTFRTEQPIVACEGIRLQHTMIVAKVLLRMFSLPVWREGEPCRWRI